MWDLCEESPWNIGHRVRHARVHTRVTTYHQLRFMNTVVHAFAATHRHRKCEDCQTKRPHFGLPDEPKKERWCGVCAKQHAGSVDIGTRSPVPRCSLA